MSDEFTHFGVFIFTAVIGYLYKSALSQRISQQVFSPRIESYASSIYRKKNVSRLLVISIDYDGTFDSNERVMAVESWVQDNMKEFDKIIVMVGSARQTKLLDRFNRSKNNNGSVEFIKFYFSNYEGVSYNDFRIHDAWFNPTQEYDSPKYALPEDFIDQVSASHEYKFPLVFSQTHYIVEHFPDFDDIQFVLIDDRRDILRKLSRYAKTFIPKNVQYTGVHLDDDLLLPIECSVYGDTTTGQLDYDSRWREFVTCKKGPCYVFENGSLNDDSLKHISMKQSKG
jgi:hypothetical protein